MLSAFLFFPREQADTGLLPQEPILPVQPELPAVSEEDDDEPAETAPALLMVDVKGAVLHPNVYTFAEGQRVIDAITAAGGYTPAADSRLPL